MYVLLFDSASPDSCCEKCSSYIVPTVGVKKTFRFGSVPFLFPFNRSGPFTSVLTVYHGQTVLALGVNLSAKFTACVGEA